MNKKLKNEDKEKMKKNIFLKPKKPLAKDIVTLQYL